MSKRELLRKKCELMFKKMGVEYFVDPRDNDGWVMYFPWCDGDIACHDFTNGGDNDVESYRFPWDNGYTSVLPVDTAITKIGIFHEIEMR